MANVGYTPIFDWLLQTKARINFLKGGANSSKSYSVAQHLLFNKFYKEKDKRILIVRKTTPAIRNSCYLLVKDLVSEYNLPQKHNKSDLTYEYGSNLILFKGLDDPEKIKSSEYNYIWCEEATELTYNDYIQLNLRLRRATDGLNQMFLSFNPIDAQHWIKKEVEDKPDGKTVIHNSTYKDNPFASQTDIEIIEDLINKDDNFYKVYALGEWGILKNIIYSGWEALTKPPENYKDISYGIDWGYESPAALVRVYWLDGDNVIWEQVIHQSKLTIPEFIELAKERLEPEDLQRDFYAGPDEPASIQEFYKAGFNIQKARNAVRDGINFCKAHLKGIIGEELIKEAQGYKRKTDKDDNVLEDPVKAFDHGMDASRYGTFSRAGVDGYSEVLEELSFR